MIDNRIKRAAEAAAGGGGGQGYNIGGGYVTVSVDLSGARQELAAFKQELGAYFAGSVVSPLGGGGLGAGNAAPAGGTQPGGASGLPGVGMPTAGGFVGFAGMPGLPVGVEPYKVDFGGGGAFAMMPLGAAQRSMPNQPANATGFYSGGGGMGINFTGGEGGGDGGEGGSVGSTGPDAAQGSVRHQWGGLTPYINPFSPRGLARVIGSGLAVYGGELALGVISGLTEAATEGPLLQQGMFRQQDRMGGYSNPRDTSAGYVASLASMQQRESAIGTFESLPLLGGIISAFDPNRLERMQQMEVDALRVSTSVGLPGKVMDADIMEAQTAGNTVRAARLQAERARHTAGEDLRRTYDLFNSSSSPEVQEAKDIFRKTALAGRYDVARAEGAYAAMPWEAEARNVTLEHDFGSAFRSLEFRGKAMEERQGAELGVASTEFERARGKLIHSRTVDMSTGSPRYVDFYTGSKEDMDAYHAAESDLGAVKRNQKLEQLGLRAEEADLRFRAGQAERQSAASAVAQVQALQNDPYGAQMTQFEAQARARQEGANALGLDLSSVTNAERQALQARHQFELGVFEDTMAARRAADDDLVARRPLTANARRTVAGAMAEVANAPKEERETLINTLQKDLQTQRILLTQQVGGQVAVDVNAYTAMGMPSALGLDLTGRQMDVSAAQGAYDNANLHNARDPSKIPGMPDISAMKTDVGNIAKWLERFKPVGVSMFSGG